MPRRADNASTKAEGAKGDLSDDEDKDIDPEAPPTAEVDSRALLSLNGLTFSPNGRRIYLSNARGEIKVFEVDKNREVRGVTAFVVPEANAPKRKEEIPTGLVVSKNGQHLYVAGNLGNKLHELDADFFPARHRLNGRPLQSQHRGLRPAGAGRRAHHRVHPGTQGVRGEGRIPPTS
jgi:DNA-binding beta-propeller fold protein YncE